MSPKDKVNIYATSSESTTSSNTSSSSSSSTSSSGSETSSSDSENSSSSQASAKSNGSTDSDKRKQPKKKAMPVKGKNATSNEGENSKLKEKNQTKGRSSKAAANYSSESEDVPIKPPPKRKPPPKPKATATVTPVNKPRQPTARAKVRARARANTNRGNTRGAASKQTESAAQKKLKTKSIFSPENSSESDDQGAQPPKLSPMKCTAKVVSHTKPKLKATAKVEPVPVPPVISKSNSSHTATSTSGTSVSSDSGSDTDSSVDSSATAKPAKKKACTIKKISSTTASTARSRTETQTQPKTLPSTADPVAMFESEGEITKPPPVVKVTRKLTRSSSARRSKHLIGKTSDTESEAEGKAKAAPVKKAAGPKGTPAQRPKTKTRASSAMDNLQKPVEEERKCPIEGCDSLGHLCGKLDKHFTIDACPLYHNKTAQECKDSAQERKKHEEDRRKAVAALSKKSPKGHLTVEHRHYQAKIKEMRAKHKPQPAEQEEPSTSEGKEREPKLVNLVPEYDLKLFQEAQAVSSEKIEDDLKTLPHVKGTKYVEIGKFEMEVWYQSPYPEEYARVPKLYICEFCLRYMKSRTILKRHMVKCVWRHPPGEEVYRKEKISVWEVDGKRYILYCQNLCLLAKFFLDHKTLYYDVEPFLFYVMTIGDSEGCHTVGYFSKEKNSFLNYNVSCILTLPPYQRQGYGRLLIDFSYLLTRVERKIGSPEKPLSDLGLISYRSYWKAVLLEFLCKFGGKELSIKDLSQEMAINSYDIVSTLQALGMMKYWKGKHIILKKQDVIEEYEERMKRRGSNYKEIDPAYLKWAPFSAPPSAGPP